MNYLFKMSLFYLFIAMESFSTPAFPTAEGFGANTTGGRGGDVVYVTNLNPSGPGSFNDALAMNKPRYILFKVSGVVTVSSRWDDIAQIRYGNVTVAGQTSPGGIIVRGFLSDNSKNTNRDNVVIRHIRSRPDGLGLDDAFRVIQCKNVIIDHCSFGHGGDECLQIGNDSNYTIQNCIFTETLGAHYDRGGILIKYSTPEFPNNNISVHHNIWNRLFGRTPLVSCDDNSLAPRCQSGPFNLEVSNNLMWDAGYPMQFSGRFLDGTPQGFHYNLNCVGNYFYVRPAYVFGMFEPFAQPDNNLFLSNNRINIYPKYSDYQLTYCCNHFYNDNPNNSTPKGNVLDARHPYPVITYHESTALPDYMVKNAGAFPRDSMDRRLMKYVANRKIDTTGWSRSGENGVIDAHLFDWTIAPVIPADTDLDGMPDYWEERAGLNSRVPDHNGNILAKTVFKDYCKDDTGYTNLECYLNILSDSLVDGRSLIPGSSSVKEKRIGINRSFYNRERSDLSVFNIRGEKISNRKGIPKSTVCIVYDKNMPGNSVKKMIKVR